MIRALIDNWYLIAPPLLFIIPWMLMSAGEHVGTVKCPTYGFVSGTLFNFTVRRAGGSGEPTIKVQLHLPGGMSSTSMDPREASQFAEILEAAAARCEA